MKYRIDTYIEFDKEFKRLSKKYHSLKSDLAALVDLMKRFLL